MDFSIIAQNPTVRQIVQDGVLERAFHDALYPRNLFRGEAFPQEFPGNVGDSMQFTGAGLMPVNAQPLTPGTDPLPSSYGAEQWSASLNEYAGTIDTDMPTSMVAIANLFMRNGHQLGLQAAATLNKIVRDRLYNASEAGWTVADGAQSGTTLRVKRLNGFTRARRPDLSGASPVAFQPVTAANPLKVTIFDNAAPVANTVVGFTPDNAGDEFGPGTLTLGTASTSVADRGYVIAYDRAELVGVGGMPNFKVDDVGSSDTLTLAAIRTAVANLRQNSVPTHEDGLYHAHFDPTSETQIYSDPEFQRLFTALPDHYAYADFGFAKMLGCAFYRNTECPLPTNVGAGDGVFTLKDPFAGELWNTGVSTGVTLHRVLITAQEAIHEYYSDLSALITEAGIMGKVGEFMISNNSITVATDRIRMILRSPQDRLQQKVSASWQFIGDWPTRTDAATGSAARYKREKIIIHGE